MYRVLGSLRTQYWFWFVRDGLIKLELDENLDSKRQAILLNLIENPTLMYVYSSEKMGVQLSKLSPYSNFDSEFSGSGDKYRNGKRIAPINLVKNIDKVIPFSQSAFFEGPSNLFSILESQSLYMAVNIIAKEVLCLCNEDILKEDAYLFEQIELLKNLRMFMVYCKGKNIQSTLNVFKTVEMIIKHLFPKMKWGNDSGGVELPKVELSYLKEKKIEQLKYIELKKAVPIAIGFGFIKAKFYDDIKCLYSVCYQEQYLTLLNMLFLIKEDSWRFNSIKKKKRSKLSKGEDSIQKLFVSAYRLTSPVPFKQRVFDLLKDWDNNGTLK